MSDSKTFTVKLKDEDQRIVFRYVGFDDEEEINIEEMLKIDYSILLAELITFPVILNKFGLLLADCEKRLSEAKLDLEIYEAKRKQEIRNRLIEEKEKFTINQIDEMLISDLKWQLKKKTIYTVQKTRDYINSVYWACKDKSEKLDKLSLTMKSDELQDIGNYLLGEGIDKLNGVMIKIRKRIV